MPRCFAIALVAILVTSLYWTGFDRFETDGPNLLPPDSRAFVLKRGGQTVGHPSLAANGQIRFRLAAEEAVELRLEVPSGGRFLRLSGRMRTEDVQLGDKDWKRARLALLSLDRDGRFIRVPNAACSFLGDRDWTDCNKVLEVPTAAKALLFRAAQRGAAGTMELELPSLAHARIKGWYELGRYGLLLIWSAIAIACVVRSRLWRPPFGWILVVICAGILIGAVAPNRHLATLVSGGSETMYQAGRYILDIARSGNRIARQSEAKNATGVERGIGTNLESAKRAGHAILFAALGGVLLLALGVAKDGVPTGRSLASVILAVSLFAVSTEVLQMLTPDRVPSFGDLGIDLAAAVLGIAIGWAGIRLFRLPERGDSRAAGR